MRRRGSTMMEVMVASAILIIGLVGVIELLLQGAMNNRRGVQPVTSSLFAQQVLAEYTMFGYSSLAEGTFDGGTVPRLLGPRLHRNHHRRFGCWRRVPGVRRHRPRRVVPPRLPHAAGDDGQYDSFP